MHSRHLFQRSNLVLGFGALLIFGLTAWLGLKGISAEGARLAIERGGYWHAWIVFILFLGLAAGGQKRRIKWFFLGWRYADRSRLGLGLLLLGSSLWLHVHQPHEFKVLADEVNLLNVSQAMHEHRYVYSPGRTVMQDGVVVAEAGYLDKRPYFFSFLVSLLHDATGYRPANSLIINGLLTFALVSGVWALGRRLDKKHGGYTAVLALCLTPIVANVATSAGFELYNITLLTWTWLICLRAWDRPSSRRIALAAVCAVALSMGRYESLLYAVPAALVLLAAMGRMSELKRWPAKCLALAPLLFLPALLLIQISFSNEEAYFQWQARGEDGTFALRFFEKNFWSAVDFFFFPHPLAMGAPLVILTGLIGWALMLRADAQKHYPAAKRAWLVCLLFSVATVVNVLIFLCFHYGSYAEYITQRISLPVFLSAIVGVVWLVNRASRRVERWGLAGVAWLQLTVVYLPTVNNDYWFKAYSPATEFSFIRRTVDGLGPERHGLMVVSSWPGAWVACRIHADGFSLRGEWLERLLKKKENITVSRLWVHVIEGTEIMLSGEHRVSAPDWIKQVEKHEVARQWLRDGQWTVIYEIVGPANLPVAETAQGSGERETSDGAKAQLEP